MWVALPLLNAVLYRDLIGIGLGAVVVGASAGASPHAGTGSRSLLLQYSVPPYSSSFKFD